MARSTGQAGKSSHEYFYVTREGNVEKEDVLQKAINSENPLAKACNKICRIASFIWYEFRLPKFGRTYDVNEIFRISEKKIASLRETLKSQSTPDNEKVQAQARATLKIIEDFLTYVSNKYPKETAVGTQKTPQADPKDSKNKQKILALKGKAQSLQTEVSFLLKLPEVPITASSTPPLTSPPLPLTSAPQPSASPASTQPQPAALPTSPPAALPASPPPPPPPPPSASPSSPTPPPYPPPVLPPQLSDGPPLSLPKSESAQETSTTHYQPFDGFYPQGFPSPITMEYHQQTQQPSQTKTPSKTRGTLFTESYRDESLQFKEKRVEEKYQTQKKEAEKQLIDTTFGSGSVKILTTALKDTVVKTKLPSWKIPPTTQPIIQLIHPSLRIYAYSIEGEKVGLYIENVDDKFYDNSYAFACALMLIIQKFNKDGKSLTEILLPPNHKPNLFEFFDKKLQWQSLPITIPKIFFTSRDFETPPTSLSEALSDETRKLEHIKKTIQEQEEPTEQYIETLLFPMTHAVRGLSGTVGSIDKQEPPFFNRFALQAGVSKTDPKTIFISRSYSCEPTQEQFNTMMKYLMNRLQEEAIQPNTLIFEDRYIEEKFMIWKKKIEEAKALLDTLPKGTELPVSTRDSGQLRLVKSDARLRIAIFPKESQLCSILQSLQETVKAWYGPKASLYITGEFATINYGTDSITMPLDEFSSRSGYSLQEIGSGLARFFYHKEGNQRDITDDFLDKAIANNLDANEQMLEGASSYMNISPAELKKKIVERKAQTPSQKPAEQKAGIKEENGTLLISRSSLTVIPTTKTYYQATEDSYTINSYYTAGNPVYWREGARFITVQKSSDNTPIFQVLDEKGQVCIISSIQKTYPGYTIEVIEPHGGEKQVLLKSGVKRVFLSKENILKIFQCSVEDFNTLQKTKI